MLASVDLSDRFSFLLTVLITTTKIMNYFISIIITAYNEEKSITAAFMDIKETLSSLPFKNEIILVNDSSTDKTEFEINEIISSHKDVVSINNNNNYGPGRSFTIGVKQAKGNIVIWMPADTEVKSIEYLKYIKLFKNYDLISFFHTNPRSRAFLRYIISLIFTKIMNLFFKTDLKYFNGPTAIRKDVYLQFIPKSNRFFFAAESKLKAIKKGYSNIQVPITLEEKKQSRTIRNIITPIKPSNVLDVLFSFLRLLWEIYFSKTFKLEQKIERDFY